MHNNNGCKALPPPPQKNKLSLRYTLDLSGRGMFRKKMTSNYTRRLFLDDDVRREHPHVRFYHLFRRRFMERLYCLMMSYTTTTVLSLLYFWCPCMAIDVRVQYNGGLLPDIILLTQWYHHRGTRLNAMKRFCICSL